MAAPRAKMPLRQRQVLRLVAEGKSNAEIAVSLQRSECTVKNHLAAAYQRLGVSGRAEAVRRGCELGIIPLAA